MCLLLSNISLLGFVHTLPSPCPYLIYMYNYVLFSELLVLLPISQKGGGHDFESSLLLFLEPL